MNNRKTVKISNEEIDQQKQYVVDINNMIRNRGFKYHIITYGCQMNVHDSEKLAGMLSAMGYTETSEQEDADLSSLTPVMLEKTKIGLWQCRCIVP